MMRDYLMAVLKGLEISIPPPPNCHHVICYARYGSDEHGWEDRLALQVNRNGRFYCLFIGDDDFDQPASLFIADVVEQMNRPLDRFVQEGVGPGRFV